jgi:hypothetical protein
MVTKSLKMIFPKLFLKNIFLVYNKIKIRTLDTLFFSPLQLLPGDFEIHKTKNPFLELNISLERFSDSIQRKLKIWTDSNWMQDEFLLRYNQAGFIEPLTGWGIAANKKLIYPSLGFAHAPYVHKPSWFALHIFKKNAVSLKKIISLRDTGEENYFHFFNDILSKLLFLQANEVDLKQYTIIVSEKLFVTKYFQYYLENTFLKSLAWHVQKNEWVHFEHAIFCKPYTHSIRFLKTEVSLLNLMPSDSLPEKRIFLTRKKNGSRFMSNADALYALVKEHGFEVVDTAEMAFIDQVKLFQKTRHLIALHGAGITNIIFRGANPLSVLEIVPSLEYIPFHYIMLTTLFDYAYDLTLASQLANDGSFDVNCADIIKHLKQLDTTL